VQGVPVDVNLLSKKKEGKEKGKMGCQNHKKKSHTTKTKKELTKNREKKNTSIVDIY